MQTDNRPLSPHLQIYKPQWTSVPSILNRATGVAITVGSLFLIWWLIALASGPDAFATAQGFFGSFVGLIVLIGLSFSLIYHTLSGIRHLVWDFGVGFEVPKAEFWAKVVVFGSIGLTILVWILACAL